MRSCAWRHGACWLAGLALAATLAGGASAADLQVSPVSLEFAAAEAARGVWLANSGRAPLRAQVRVYTWTQDASGDRLEPAQGVIASPPALEIAPGSRQLVRVVRTDKSPVVQERTYRLLVDELPAEKAAPPAGGLQFLLRYSIPIFVAGERAAAPVDPRQLAVDWQRGPQPSLAIANHGARRIRIAGLVHEDAAGQRTVLVPGLLGYVLAGSHMRWPLPPQAAKLPAGTLKARLDDAAQEQTLPLAAGDS